MRRTIPVVLRGVFPAAFGIVAVLTTWAAEAPKKQTAPGPLPRFSVPGGIFTNDVVVKLATDAPAEVIRYTMDGSAPTAASPKYSSPIQVTNSAVIKAAVFENGSSAVGASVSQSYILMDTELANFNSNLPLVIINTFGRSIPHGEKVPASARFLDASGNRSSLLGAPDFDGTGEINVRGHTSLRYPKHSYHFKIRDEARNPLKASVLGLPKDSDWVLYAPFPDKTLMRDVLGYDLSNKLGRYAPRTRFVEVFVNESRRKLARRDYLGVYVFEEKIKRGSNRVAIEKLTPDDNTEPQLTGGYIFKKDHLDTVEMGPAGSWGGQGGPSRSGGGFLSGPGGFPANPEGFFPAEGSVRGALDRMFQGGGRGPGNRVGLVTSYGSQFLFVEPKPEEISGPQKAWLSRYLNAFENSLYNPKFADPKTGYAAYIDPDSFIDHHLLVEVTKNIDGFRFSTFYHKDRGDRLKMGPLWDWNLSFGNANGKQGWMPDRWYWPQLDDQQYSWFRRLFEDPDFAQKYVDRWGQLRTNQFATAAILATIDKYSAELSEAQDRNFKRWRILGRQVWPNSYVGQTYADEVNWMKQWVQTRITWIDKQFVAAPILFPKGGVASKENNLVLRGSGKIYFTLDGTDPRSPGGGVSRSARLYSSAINLSQDATVFTRALQGTRWSYPAVSQFQVGDSPTSKKTL